MLTAEHVKTRSKGGELVLVRLAPKDRARAEELAAHYLDVARAHVGRTRDELVEAWEALPIAPREQRLAGGLRKLVEDAAEMSAQSPADPVELRREVFTAASEARSDAEGRIDRSAILESVANARGLSAPDLERALYADLKGEQILLAVEALTPATLVDRYESGQVQAVLLRAVKVIADVTCAAPSAYRALFRELKFRRLLFRIERHGGGYRIEIDGPFSVFEQSTRYGLALAMLLPALEACDSLALVAEVRWGKRREALRFRHVTGTAPEKGRTVPRREPPPRLRDDVAELVEAFKALDTPWRATENDEILELPGIGVCIPDVVFSHAKTGARVYFEALGFWSRDAVWKRVELVKEGLARPILFAVSSRLRVSESVLDDDETAALYVYKGVMSPRSIERKLSALATRR
jgi:predicted nuclease of restriction endonuclease-like RecB superfamily